MSDRMSVEQAARIARLEDELHHVTQHALAQGRRLRRQAEQIERLQDGLREIEEWELTASSTIADLVESGVILEEDMQ